MRFSRISISGYGRFSETDLDLDQGLQIIAGPNEGGKTTLRYFIGDMLFGQKRSATRRLYDDANELRAPWNSANGYGGRLSYRLDSGHEIEVERSFEVANEFVRVFDRTDARDITGQFPVLKNRESTFAESHLNMTKSVFLGIATISHTSLSELGDHQALMSIREKLLSLTDSGNEDSSAERAMKWLNDRIGAIGQPTARTKPLPVTRQRLLDLQAEYQEVHEAAKEVAVFKKQRAGILENVGSLIYRRSAIERDLKHRETIERAELLRKAEALEDRINSLTKRCFGLGDVRGFSADNLTEVQRLATLVDTTEKQVGRTQAEMASVNQQMAEAVRRLEQKGVPVMKEPDADIESRLAELDREIGALSERQRHAEKSRLHAENDIREAQAAVENLPDFTPFSPDPVQYFSQLGSQFDIARHARADEETRLKRTRELESAKREALAGPRELFEQHGSFLAELRSYEDRVHGWRDAADHDQQEAARMLREAEDLGGKFPGFTIFALVSLVASVFFALIATYTSNEGIYLPAGILAVMFVFAGASAFIARRRLQGLRTRIVDMHENEQIRRDRVGKQHELVEDLMTRASCETTRELEALYDRYQHGLADLAALEQQAAEQEDRLHAAEQRLADLREHVIDSIAKVRETLERDEDFHAVSMRVLSRYQEYRDAKRRASEQRDAVKRHKAETAELEAGLRALKDEEVELSLPVREFMSENHYPEERNFDSALEALRGYRIRSAQMRQKQSDLDVYQGQIKMVRRQLETEQAELVEHRKALERELSQAGVPSLEKFQEKSERAREYGDLWKERTALQDQLETLLGEQDLNTLRQTVAASEEITEGPTASTEELQRELMRINEELDAKRKQEHALHIMMTERAAGLRTLNEVDEERAATEQRMAELELELQAAAYAVSIIDEVTREQHSRIAPRLADLASRYLSEITGGVYDELLVDRDMQISVRIPQTKSMNADPERRLSKGTVDQIYLALRLAMVQSMSHGAESIPMVLDDPFTNYDDTRLRSAMELLGRIGQTNQVLLFTCRDDVVRAAEAIQAPIVRL